MNGGETNPTRPPNPQGETLSQETGVAKEKEEKQQPISSKTSSLSLAVRLTVFSQR